MAADRGRTGANISGEPPGPLLPHAPSAGGAGQIGTSQGGHCVQRVAQVCQFWGVMGTIQPPGPVCMEKGFATLPVNPTQAVATVAVRIWFGPHA